MSLKKCVDNAVAAGELTLEEAQDLKKEYDRLARKILSKGAVRDKLIAKLEAEAEQRKRVALKMEVIRQEGLNDIMNHINAAGQNDPMEALMWKIDHNEQARFESVKQRITALRAMAHERMQTGIQKFRASAKVTGDLARHFGHRKDLLKDVTRERFGEATGNDLAKKISDEFGQVADLLHEMHTEAGGAIGKLEGWALPTHWNQDLVRNSKPDEFVNDFLDELDLERMRHPLTGEPLSREEAEESLRFIHENLSTDGWKNREPSGQVRGKGALFKQRMDHRFLHFKNADGWMKLQKKYGDGDPWTVMMGHISSMTRDVGMMQILSPNPIAMRQYWKESVFKWANTIKPNNVIRQEQLEKLRNLIHNLPASIEEKRYDLAMARADLDERLKNRTAGLGGNNWEINALQKKIDKLSDEILSDIQDLEWPLLEPRGLRIGPKTEEASRLLSQLREEMPDTFRNPVKRAEEFARTSDIMFDMERGVHGMPSPGFLSENFAHFMQGMRNMQVATKLGAAGVSAISDVGLQRAARVMAGMPTSGVIRAYLKQYGPGMQQKAMRQGLIVDSALHYMDQQTRYGLATSFSGWTGYAADRTLGLGGLSWMTQTGKHATGLEIQAFAADMLDTSWNDLPKLFRRSMEYSGIQEKHWRSMQAAGANSEGFLAPADVFKIDREAALKYSGHVHKLMRVAVSEPTLRERAALIGGTEAGTIHGEFLRSFWQFKGFGTAVLFHYTTAMYRSAARDGILGNNEFAQYAISVFVIMTIMGGVAIQLKDMKDGRDPRPMDEKFWAAAMLQGGGIGIYGDFLFADHNRYGGSAMGTAFGPAGGTIEEALKLTFGNAQELAQGKDTNAGREAIKFIGKQMIPGNNIWYLRLAYERKLLDVLTEWSDPKMKRAFRRQVRNRKRDYGQGYWWGPGDDAPSRLPDFANAIP